MDGHCSVNRWPKTGANHITILYWNERNRPATDTLSVADRQRILSEATVCGTPPRNRQSLNLHHALDPSFLWDVTPCKPVEVHRRMGGTHCFHLQVRTVSQNSNRPEAMRSSQTSSISTILHGVTYRKMALFVVITVRTSSNSTKFRNLILLFLYIRVKLHFTLLCRHPYAAVYYPRLLTPLLRRTAFTEKGRLRRWMGNRMENTL